MIKRLLYIPIFFVLAGLMVAGCQDDLVSSSSTTAEGAGSVATMSHNGPCDVTVSSGNSIQTAVNSATSGQTVCVDPGTYDENVVIDVQNLTLHGTNAGISGDGDRGSEAVISDGVKIDADGVTVDGFQVESDDVNGIRFENPVDNATVKNNVITNVSGGTFGAPAGGNGVQIQLTGATDEVADGIEIRNNKISNITTPDNTGAGRTLAIGVNVLPRGNDVTNLVIDGNVITDIEPGPAGTERRARAISIDTQLDGDDTTGRVDGVEITNNDISDLRADRFFAVSLFEDGSVNPRRGVQNFLIKRNDFSNFTATSDIQAAIFIGGYEELGDDHKVTLNNFRDGFVERFNSDQEGFTPGQEDALSAECNYWGHATGPQPIGDEAEDNPQGRGQGVLGPVDYRPWSVRAIGTGVNPEKSCVGGMNRGDDGPGNGNGPGGGPGA